MPNEQPRFRVGQAVRIIACANNMPEHVGKVGAVRPAHPSAATVRVYLGPGICQATAVEAVQDTLSEEIKPRRYRIRVGRGKYI
jgi:hypothetical protein